jgi:thioredoxin 1
MKDVTDDNFESEVLKSDVPTVVDFWAPWCGPCRIFSPTVEEVEKELGSKVKFCKLNTDENQKTAGKYNIMSIPTAMLFVGGKPKATSVGAVPKESFRKWLEKSI